MPGIFSESGRVFKSVLQCSKDEGNCLRARLEVYFVLLEYIFFDIRNMGSQNDNIMYSNQVLV